MKCNWITRRLIVCVLSVLVLLAISGTIGNVSATPGSPDEPMPITPPTPDGLSTGDALLLLDLVLVVGNAVLL